MAQLPRFAAFKSKNNNNYLTYVHDTNSQVYTFLRYSGDHVLTPYTKYELHRAQSDPSLVNIRCCYNNKYWVTSPTNRSYIVAQAESTEEDRSKWTCTLFQPIYDSTHQAFRFRHVHRGNFVCLFRTGAPFTNCLVANWSTHDRDLCDLSTVVDWEALHALPKHLAFVGDNEKFLQGRWIERHPYLEFSADDIGNPAVGMESFITRDGYVRFKSNFFNRFWRAPIWIWADSTDTTDNNRQTLFSPTRVNDETYALRSLGNNNFCKRITMEGKTSVLRADVRTIDLFSRLVVKELVLERDIFNVRFRSLDSRIYNESIIGMASQTATNTSQTPNTMGLVFTYTESTSSTWTSSVSMKLGVTTTITTGVPFIAEGKVEINTEFSGGYEWGGTKTSSKEVESAYSVTVPPRTVMIVRLVATRGTCDVPYSYTQRDTLMNGQIVTYKMDDGVYQGVNVYNFDYQIEERPIAA